MWKLLSLHHIIIIQTYILEFETEIIESIIESDSYNDLKDSIERNLDRKMYPPGLSWIITLQL